MSLTDGSGLSATDIMALTGSINQSQYDMFVRML